MPIYLSAVSKLEPGQQKVGRGPTAVTMERATEGVWLMRGGFPDRVMNVYFIEEPGGGVTVFDAAIRSMTKHVAEVGRIMGGIKRVVLSHAHPDHRGVAPGIDAPVWCHEADRADAEGDGGIHYFRLDELPRFSKLGPIRALYPHLLRMWDGGPVRIERTIAEGESVAGFEVVHFPGHAPGLIGLWRERDRLALVSDVFYTLDPLTGEPGYPRLPLAPFNHDHEQTRASIRKLAAMEPREAWPGHMNPLTGDVRGQLETAAATT
jgi:glyoxylase-like metal-dependent hydrolase (beta-lactamase superfamily II)